MSRSKVVTLQGDGGGRFLSGRSRTALCLSAGGHPAIKMAAPIPCLESEAIPTAVTSTQAPTRNPTSVPISNDFSALLTVRCRITFPARQERAPKMCDGPCRTQTASSLPRYLHRPPGQPTVDPMPEVTSELAVGPIASGDQSTRWAAQWPHVDATCMRLYAVYKRLRRNRIRRLARSIGPVRLEIDSDRHSTYHGLLLFDGSTSPLSIALLGSRLSWERRFSIRTLVGCPKHYPPFGLLE